MGSWTAAADALLTAATGAVVPVSLNPDDGTVTLDEVVSRVFIAPGPDFARDCSLLAVSMGTIRGLPVASDTDLGPQFGCVLVPTVTLTLVFREDCVPTANAKGRPPAADRVERWAALHMERATILWQTIADAVLGGALDVGGCHDATLGDGTTVGPGGGMAGLDLPVTVRLQA